MDKLFKLSSTITEPFFVLNIERHLLLLNITNKFLFQLLKTLPVLQKQMDALLEFDVCITFKHLLWLECL